ncbi:putative F-box/kelch-repeat protein At3g22730 [Cornus florida]|uniref:putative F-box/kelch-repeat protein At3g22730 n=1 Tax=Cornus florida TaxID=4283 RepID=UPI0028A0B91C|nr:putative F-box/kelch-repeat protein At3g22730 [Cornus florida]
MLRDKGDNHTSENDIIEILLRLPVKALLRFKCVCKTWNALIRNSNFVTKQLNHHSNNARLLIQYHNYCTEKFAFALILNEILTKEPLLSHDLDFQHMRCDSGVIGPLNGILGLWNWNRIALWNPATKEFRFLSIPHSNLPPHFRACSYYFGFGLDLTTNDCKLIWIRDFWDNKIDTLYDPRVVSVYTLGSDSWRVFEVDLYGSIQDSLGNTYMNGFYYWLTNEKYDKILIILSFDIGNEVFREIKMPPDMAKSKWGDLSMYNDSLAMFIYDPNEVEKYIDIWLMTVEECWMKELTIGPLLDVERPLGFWKNGELFLELETGESVLYNPNTGETKDLRHRGKDDCLKVLIYKESLVSIKEGNDF